MSLLRCFVAIELNDAVRGDLVELRRRLDDGGRGVSWVAPENLHLTLKFLGPTAASDLPRVGAALQVAAATCDEVDTSLAGVGCFPANGAPRVIWAGLADEDGALGGLHAACEVALAEIGWPLERRAFAPHITLARIRNSQRGRAMRPRVEKHGAFRGAGLRVASMTLFEARLSPEGARYLALSRYALGAAR